MKNKRQILDKHWNVFALSAGIPISPMSEKAYEMFENAMEEYAQSNQEDPKPDIRKEVMKEVYAKWNEFDNEFFFVQWLFNEVKV